MLTKNMMTISIKNVTVKVTEDDIKYVIEKMLFVDFNTNINIKTINEEIKNMFETQGYIYNGGPTPSLLYVSELMNQKYDREFEQSLLSQCETKVNLIFKYLYR